MSNTQKITYCRQKEEELLEIRLNVTQTPFLSSSLYDYPQALISYFSPPITQDRNRFLWICVSSRARDLVFYINQELLKYILRIPLSLLTREHHRGIQPLQWSVTLVLPFLSRYTVSSSQYQPKNFTAKLTSLAYFQVHREICF